jgi:hypothetical protein
MVATKIRRCSVKATLGSWRYHHATRISIFLIAVALIVGMVGYALTQCNLTIPRVAGAEVTTMAESSENTTTYDGDLVIDGYEEFIIENCTWIQKGNIYVKDHARLIVRNATLQLSQNYFYQYEFKVENFATLIMENAELTSDYGLNFHFLDDSAGSIHNLNIDIGEFSSLGFFGRSKLEVDSIVFEGSHGIHVGDYADVSITSSVIGSIEIFPETPIIRIADSEIAWRFGLFFMNPESEINIKELTPGFKEYLDLGERIVAKRHGSYIPIRITLSETNVQRWHIGMLYNLRSVISDSTLFHFRIFASSISCSVENLKASFYSQMRIGQIVLNQTRITNEVAFTLLQDAEVTIIDSALTLLLGPGDNSHAYIINSTISGPHADYFSGSLSFDGATLGGFIRVLYSALFIYGDFSFKDFGDVVWHEGTVTREYGMVVKDAYGNPVSDANLTLRSKDGTQIWNGTTDSQGRANFDLTFTDDNYTDTLTLEAVKDDLLDAQDVTFLSDTPIVLTVLAQHNLTISSTTGGSVTNPGEGTFTYDQETGINLVAKAEEGYQFANWTGNVDTIADVNAASTTITMNGDYSIIANFEEEELPMTPQTGCFIATAAYGTPMAEEIQILREFRAECLLTNSLGQGLVDVYYTVSPPVADFITEHPSLKPIVRAGLMPVVAMCSIVLDIVPQFAGNEE